MRTAELGHVRRGGWSGPIAMLAFAVLAAGCSAAGPATRPGGQHASGMMSPATGSPVPGRGVGPAVLPSVASVVSLSDSSRAARPPAVAGSALRALWQGAPWASLTVSGGRVFGLSYQHNQDDQIVVNAAAAATGATDWTTAITRRLPEVLDLVAGAGVVVVLAGRSNGSAPLPVVPVVTTAIVLDQATGRPLWWAHVWGGIQDPSITVTTNAVLIGTPSGMITARQARTGNVLWQRSRPAGCTAPRAVGPLGQDMALSADGSLLVASYECGQHRALVQRLAAGTGRVVWSWRSPAGLRGQLSLAVTEVATTGNVVLLTGQDAPPASAQRLASLLPRPYLWPQALGPRDDVQVVLAINALSGKPSWTELGGQLTNFTLADRAVCESVNTGFECRDDATGALTRAVMVTGQRASASPPYGADGFGGFGGSSAAVTVAPFRSGHVTVDLVPIRAGAAGGSVTVAIGARAYHANYQTFVVASGTLPDGASLYLLRRVDKPGYPVIALTTGR